MKNVLDFRPFTRATATGNITPQCSKLTLRDSDFSSLLAEACAHRQLYELDPHLTNVVNSMACGWSVEDLPRLMYCNDSGIVAFDDSWTLFAWSLWWTHRHQADPSLEVVVLHADDHRDLVSPLLVKVERWLESGDERWIDLLTGRQVSLDDAESVALAILSGAIGIGTFMVPLIHSLRRVEIRHLCLGAKDNVKFGIGKSVTDDPRLLS